MIIRQATPADAPEMVTILNDIIVAGGTTAHETPFDADRMRAYYIGPPKLIACHVAEDDGKVIGFQFLRWPIEHDGQMPDGWSIIASFVATAAAGKGAGQHLFAATRIAAANAGVRTIDATIRADNTVGLRYYDGLGFVDFDRRVGIPLKDGTPVDRIRKRYDL